MEQNNMSFPIFLWQKALCKIWFKLVSGFREVISKLHKGQGQIIPQRIEFNWNWKMEIETFRYYDKKW